jgi:ABC-type glycerol-3-phosphate transport system substrate-binding protein
VKDAAAEFLDYLYAEKPVVDMIEKASFISPRPVDVAALSLSDFQKRSVTSVSTGDGDPAVNQGVFVNHGRSGPEFLRTMTSGFQAMMAGDKTAAQQAADLQAAWEKDNA